LAICLRTYAKTFKNSQLSSTRHPEAGQLVGRLVIAEGQPGGLAPKMFLGIAAHELIELSHRARAEREGWIEPELNTPNNWAPSC
jgi:hypothetical protein